VAEVRADWRHGLRSISRPALLLAIGGGATLLGQALAAEALGPVEFGRFALFVQATAILATLAIFGFDNAIVRHITAARGEDRDSAVPGLVAAARAATLRISVAATAAGIALLALVEDFGLSLPVVLALALAVPATVRLRLDAAAARAAGKPDLAITAERLFRDAPLIALAAAALLWPGGARPGAGAAAVAVVLGVLIGILIVRRHAVPPAPAGDAAALGRSARRFAAFAVADAVFQRMDIFIVSALLGERFAGLFGAALIVTSVCGFGAILSTYVYVPRIGTAFSAGRPAEAERLLRASAWVALAASAAVLALWAVYIAFLSDFLLTEYADAAGIVAIMIAAQLVNAMTGSAGPTLGVIGFERDLAGLYVASMITKLALTLALVGEFGFIGVGVSLVLCYALLNAALGVMLWRRARIVAGILSLLRAR
jgi:O-antigen/teichoic acid export membrane protein